ncbi:hypothetical protein IEQ34_009787 [Dendrobium chrysotoxum]|uniref:Uncharacterized protein n=1 Tax=Dendrobium chrysotoxum TaxID=161865 RepID=A0AAV7H2Z2_DENCH|nr:hypothetical protein IEQ34_009787 [Dendrobium chrysotoxum]
MRTGSRSANSRRRALAFETFSLRTNEVWHIRVASWPAVVQILPSLCTESKSSYSCIQNVLED